jgi:hypothetical protein
METKVTRYVPIEFRSQEEKESRTVGGLSAVFRQTTDMGWYTEEIDPHAFDEADMSDVVLTLNHNFDYVLAGTRNGSLKLGITDDGLANEATIVDTTQGNDCLKLVREGLINKQSFCFVIDEDEWVYREGKEKDHRIIKRIGKVFDTALVTFPAYPQTSVGIRSKSDLDPLAKKHFEQKEIDKKMEEQIDGFIKNFV